MGGKKGKTMSDLKDRLERGDVTQIAKMVGVSYETAKKVLKDGTRNNEKVVQTAENLLAFRESAKPTKKNA